MNSVIIFRVLRILASQNRFQSLYDEKFNIDGLILRVVIPFSLETLDNISEYLLSVLDISLLFYCIQERKDREVLEYLKKNIYTFRTKEGLNFF